MIVQLSGANHIADCILATAKLDSNIELDQLQLNKLCYLVNGFTLRERDKPAFHNRVEAWKFGPVVPEVYVTYRYYGDRPITMLDLCRTNLNDTKDLKKRWSDLVYIIGKDVAAIVYGVVKEYGKYSGWDLVYMTHRKHTPWKKVYRPGHNNIIPTEEIREFYRNLRPGDDRR